jgi:hypothetical protein
MKRRFEQQKISTELFLQKKKTSNSIENSQAGRHGFDPRRPLQSSKNSTSYRSAQSIFLVLIAENSSARAWLAAKK